MSFNNLAKKASKLTVEQQSDALFLLIGNLNAYYKYELDQQKTLTKKQAIDLVADSLSGVKN